MTELEILQARIGELELKIAALNGTTHGIVESTAELTGMGVVVNHLVWQQTVTALLHSSEVDRGKFIQLLDDGLSEAQSRFEPDSVAYGTIEQYLRDLRPAE